MNTRSVFLLVLQFAVGLLLGARASSGAQPSAQVLPASTKFHLSVANQQRCDSLLATTELGKLLSDPAMKPFLDDLPRQMRGQASDHPLGVLWIDLGVESGDLKGLSEGEVAWALVHPDGGTPSRVLMADVTGRQQQADALLQKITASMREQNAKTTRSEVEGTTVTLIDIPAAGDLAARQLVYFQQDNQLVFAETMTAAQLLLKNLGSDAANRLADETGYQQVVKLCRDRAGGAPPDAVLFLVPVDFSEALQELSPEKDQRAAKNLAIARKHNFDAISAVGSYITVGQGPFDFQFRIAVYAPQPWKNGMRICRFPNKTMSLPPWVRGDNHSCTMINLDFAELSRYVGPLFDDVYGEGEEGLYDDLKNTLLEDPDGPQINVDQEIYGRLSPQITLLARDALPVTPDSPQRLIAFSTTDEAALAAVVKKALEADPNVEARQVAGHDAFFSYVEEVTDDFSAQPTAGPQDQDKPPSFITCVANGHLMFATDLKILEDALTVADGNSLANHADYKSFAPHWQLMGDAVCVQFFGRLQDLTRVNFELLRQGKKPNSDKSFRGLLNNIAAGEPPEMDEPKLDGSKLPPFDEVQEYFGLAGLTGVATDDGWYLEGFILKKQ